MLQGLHPEINLPFFKARLLISWNKGNATHIATGDSRFTYIGNFDLTIGSSIWRFVSGDFIYSNEQKYVA